MTKVIETNIEQLIPDDKNFNKGTEYGQKLMEAVEADRKGEKGVYLNQVL